MKLNYDENVGIDGITADDAIRAISAVLSDAHLMEYDIEISLTLTDPVTVRELNREHRNIDDTTDVLSFPMYALKADDYDELIKEIEEISGVGGNLLLGDIVINSERVVSQAAEYGHSILREYTFLIVHSMLHLLGYDHIDDDDREVMEEKQRIIMNALSITRNT